MAMSCTSLVFKVQRCEPELVTPAKDTPREIKELSDIDHQSMLRLHVAAIDFYAHNPSMQGRDPVKVIREAIAQALVFYYPFAGRLRERPNKKLIVDCTGEGVLFIEANADVSLEQFGYPIHPPFPYFDELLYGPPTGSDRILNYPLLYFQVTRLKCGGFTVAYSVNHVMGDGTGAVQLLSAIGELARGCKAPSIMPVWKRAALNARDPPRITCIHNEYVDNDDVAEAEGNEFLQFKDEGITHRCFLVGPTELSTIRRLIPSHLHPCSRFEVLTAFLWKCYASASQKSNPNEVLRLQLCVNARNKCELPLPKGYYGNAVASPVAVATVGDLCLNPIGYALELIRKAKARVDDEYMRSLADLTVIKGQPKAAKAYELSDLSRLGFDQVDYGWGKSVYSGPPKAWADHMPGAGTYYLPFKTKNGEQAIMALVSLQAPVMERFIMLFEKMLKAEPGSN